MLFVELTELVSMKEPRRLAVFRYFEEITDSSEWSCRTIGLRRREGSGDIIEVSCFLFIPGERSFLMVGHCHKLLRDFELLAVLF